MKTLHDGQMATGNTVILEAGLFCVYVCYGWCFLSLVHYILSPHLSLSQTCTHTLSLLRFMHLNPEDPAAVPNGFLSNISPV